MTAKNKLSAQLEMCIKKVQKCIKRVLCFNSYATFG